MRIRISQETSYAYAPPAKSVIQVLRLTPRSHEGQHVARWRISTDVDCVLRQSEDSLGNIVHTFSHARAIERIAIVAEGEVETSDTAGIVRGSVEPLLPEIFLRASPLAEPNGALRDFAQEAAQGRDDALDRLHALMAAIDEAMVYEAEPARSATLAAEAFALRRGAGGDFAHVFIACARWLGAPARYVSGYFLRDHGESQEAGHAWAEAHVPGLGWIGFDCANCVCPGENHIRVAVGFDHLSAAPVRASRAVGGEETMKVALTVGQAQGQRQS